MKSCLGLLLLPFLPVLLLISTCNRACAPEPVAIESVAACHGTWHMKQHDAYPQQGYAAGKTFTLHADGRAECHGLLRRDLAEDFDEAAALTPVPAEGKWECTGHSGGEYAPYVELTFPDGFRATARFYRQGGYGDGPRELWFPYGDPDSLQWVQYRRAE